MQNVTRHSTIRKDGKTHVYGRPVRSVQRNGKVVQETAAQLGELDARRGARARDLARQIMGRGDQGELFEDPPGRDETVAVLVQVRLEPGRRFGGVWLGWKVW